jgi:hypothetical protein
VLLGLGLLVSGGWWVLRPATSPEVLAPRVEPGPSGTVSTVAAPPTVAPEVVPPDPVPPLAPTPLRKRTTARASTSKPAREGWLTVDVRPGWAEVWVDGTRRGETPVFRLVLAQGPHELELVRRSGLRKKQRVLVAAGQVKKVIVSWPDP